MNCCPLEQVKTCARLRHLHWRNKTDLQNVEHVPQMLNNVNQWVYVFHLADVKLATTVLGMK